MALMYAGVDYCLAHNGGIREEDENVCDFADKDETCDCELTPLFYEDGERKS